jgi:hypothetical protein
VSEVGLLWNDKTTPCILHTRRQRPVWRVSQARQVAAWPAVSISVTSSQRAHAFFSLFSTHVVLAHGGPVVEVSQAKGEYSQRLKSIEMLLGEKLESVYFEMCDLTLNVRERFSSFGSSAD